MIIDCAGGGPELDLEADLCVIGAGAAGLTVVRELLGSALRICVLETGGLDRSPVPDALNELVADGSPELELLTTRPRVFGGSTAEWGGMCCPLDAGDFESRPGLPLHNWPISADQLTPYYRRAHTALGLGPSAFDESLWPGLRIRPPAVDPRLLRTSFWQYRSPGVLPPDSPLRFGPAYRAQVTEDRQVTTVLNATVVDIYRAPGVQRVERVGFRGQAGRLGRVWAAAFVLAGGAIENVRLLLSSDFRDASPAIGRYFMEHPHVPVGALPRRELNRLLPGWAVLQRRGPVALRPKLQPTPAYQLDRDVLNASMALELRCAPDCPHRALSDAARELRAQRPLTAVALGLRAASAHPGLLAGAAYRRSLGRPACPGHGGIVLYSRSEQEPNPASRVVLDDSRDALGQQRAKVQWRLTERDRRTVVDFAHLVGSQLRGLGARNLTLAGWLDEASGWPERLHGGPHHSGTTRMSATSATGVVDRNSRVHGVANLYVVGPSVFPTGGYANPMYTTVALAIRAADHLRTELLGRRPIVSTLLRPGR